MSSNCMPDKQARSFVLRQALVKVAEAFTLLSGINHPDDNPRKMEEAAGLLSAAIGDYGDADQPVALDDLCEHYFG